MVHPGVEIKNTIADDSPPAHRTRAAAKGNMTPNKRTRLQRIAEDLAGLTTEDYYNYISENVPSRGVERAYVTLGFGDEPLSRKEAMDRADWHEWQNAEKIEKSALEKRGTFNGLDVISAGRKENH